MNKRNFWGFLGLLAMALTLSFSFVSCGDDDEEGDNNGGALNGGNGNSDNKDEDVPNVQVQQLDGTYVAFTSPEYQCAFEFHRDGTGTFRRNYSGGEDEPSHRTRTFNYNCSGNEGRLVYADDPEDYYNIKVNSYGMVMIEESGSHPDIKYILYPRGTRFGAGSIADFAGTWFCEYVWDDGESMTQSLVINRDGTFSMRTVDRWESVEEVVNSTGTVIVLNEFLIQVDAKVTNEADGSEFRYTASAVKIYDTLYLLDEDGEVDESNKLTRQ